MENQLNQQKNIKDNSNINQKSKINARLIFGLLFAVVNLYFVFKWINFQELKLWFLYRNSGYFSDIINVKLGLGEPRVLVTSIISLIILLIVIFLTVFLTKNKKRQNIYLILNILILLFLWVLNFVSRPLCCPF